MKDRLITALGALIALLLVVGMFAQQPLEPPATRPTTVEGGPNGYLALARWLEGQDLEVVSFRDRFTRLSGLDGLTRADGNLLITTAPYKHKVQRSELAALKTWIKQGNTLVVMAALDDTPDWTLTTDTSTFVDDLEELTGLRFEPLDEEFELGDLFEANTITLTPTVSHPLTRSVESLNGISDFASSIWAPEESAPARLALAAETGSTTEALWLLRSGAGRIIVAASSSMFTNRVIGDADNRRLIANLVLWHLKPRGAVIFDDMHQGLSALYDPEAFYKDPRVGITITFLLAFWLLYMLGTSNRLTPVIEPQAVPRQHDFVKAVGGFMARKLSPADGGLLMFATWFLELEQRPGLQGRGTAADSVWDYLYRVPTVDKILVRSLQQTYERLARGQETDLTRLHNQLRTLRRAMA